MHVINNDKIASMYKIYQSCNVFSSLNFYMMFYVLCFYIFMKIPGIRREDSTVGEGQIKRKACEPSI